MVTLILLINPFCITKHTNDCLRIYIKIQVLFNLLFPTFTGMDSKKCTNDNASQEMISQFHCQSSSDSPAANSNSNLESCDVDSFEEMDSDSSVDLRSNPEDVSDTEASSLSHSASNSEFDYSSQSDNDEINTENCSENNNFLTNEFEALKILSCFRRHNLTASACKDILDTMKTTFSDSKRACILDFEYLNSFVEANAMTEVHYCELCNTVFPEDPNEFTCNHVTCEGLRYKGPRSKQEATDRQPRKYFIVADIEKQLKDLLMSPGNL